MSLLASIDVGDLTKLAGRFTAAEGEQPVAVDAVTVRVKREGSPVVLINTSAELDGSWESLWTPSASGLHEVRVVALVDGEPVAAVQGSVYVSPPNA